MHSILQILRDHAFESVDIGSRVYVSFNDNRNINTRYWITYGILSSGVRDSTAKIFSRKIAYHFSDSQYKEKSNERLLNILSKKENGERYRFPTIRSKWLHESFLTLQHFDNALPINASLHHSKQRDDIVDNFKGIGLKQASLLLRNLGYSYECCVVDTHIVDFLTYIGWIPNSIKTKGINRKRYFAIEALFRRLAKFLSTPVSILDVATWDITRMIKAEKLV